MVVTGWKTENQNYIVSDANVSFWSQKDEILFLIRESICEKIEAGSLFISTFSSHLCPVHIMLCLLKFCKFVDSLNQMSFFNFDLKPWTFSQDLWRKSIDVKRRKATVSVLITAASSATPQPWIYAPTATAISVLNNSSKAHPLSPPYLLHRRW